MTIDSGDYCQYCTDDSGSLRSFDETFERFVQFALGRDAALDRATAEANTLTFMGRMPAWKEHPRLNNA
jgi:hypothetical protein